MADLQHAFNEFYAHIVLTHGNKVVMQMAREAIRERIRRYFRNTLHLKPPMFQGQGAYVMGTMVNPIGGEYNIDDGVYLQHLDYRNDGDWPSAETVHRWLKKALDGHYGGKTEERRTFVRVRFRGLYHVDLTVYGQLNGQLRLAVRGTSNWPNSDPISLSLWFGSHIRQRGEQLRRIVCYIKAWADFQSRHWGDMPDELKLTILAVQHYQYNERDDIALACTLKTISNAACSPFYVPNPVDISEQLIARITHIQKIKFQEAIKQAAEDATQTLSLSDTHKALKTWRKIFGDRFPKV